MMLFLQLHNVGSTEDFKVETSGKNDKKGRMVVAIVVVRYNIALRTVHKRRRNPLRLLKLQEVM